MRDLLSRLLEARPAVETWLAELHQRNAPHCVPPGDSGLARLGQCVPRSVLDRARAVLVEDLPFPPVTALGLPEFEPMAAMPMDGITFGDMYFLRREHASEALHFHELVHVVQWSALGVGTFLPTYAVGLIQHGYRDSPLESTAYALQARFERGQDLPDLVGFIAAEAEHARQEAEDLFRSVGLSMAPATMSTGFDDLPGDPTRDERG